MDSEHKMQVWIAFIICSLLLGIVACVTVGLMWSKYCNSFGDPKITKTIVEGY